MNPNETKYTVKNGNYAGLVITFIHTSKLKGMTAVKVTHSAIANFEARALMPLGTTFKEALEAVQSNVRLI